MSLFVHFERNISNCTDCSILSLTWMGRIPQELEKEQNWWSLKSYSYYEDGWLATGNVRGVIGITLTTSHCQQKLDELPTRANYNLRGHRSHVTLVQWNEPYQKLASCDSSGTIFVWIQHEGRWAIELMNDRKTPVTDFSWSHHGRLALICYQDGFVLVGSVTGQRYWSSMLHLDSLIMCGVWTPDDQQVLLGTSSGQILVIDVSGQVECEITVKENIAITMMTWSCQKFSAEEHDESMTERLENDMKPLLAVCLENGSVYLMKSYDDLSPIKIKTQLNGIKISWSHSGELLAIAGALSESNGMLSNWVYFYTGTGAVRSSIRIPYHQEPVTAITWGHMDKRLFIATGCVVNVAWISFKLASLQLLSAMAVQKCLTDRNSVQELPVVQCLQSLIYSLFGRTLKCHLPDANHIREYVSMPPPNNNRLHCTMIHHVDDDITGSVTYTLFLENLGGLVPILKGKRVSTLRPEFVIFDPFSSDDKDKMSNRISKYCHSVSCENSLDHTSTSCGPAFISTSSSESEPDEGCVSPHMQRRRQRLRQLGREHRMLRRILTSQKYVYVDVLPEDEKIVSVTSNIWGTKFKVLGLVPWLPVRLGTITYRTSLLHLQPRQLKIVIKELSGPLKADLVKNAQINKGIENSGVEFTDDEDEIYACISPTLGEDAPVAPMTPKKQRKSLVSSFQIKNYSSKEEYIGEHDCINFLPSEKYISIDTSTISQKHTVENINSNECFNTDDINSNFSFPKSEITSLKTNTTLSRNSHKSIASDIETFDVRWNVLLPSSDEFCKSESPDISSEFFNIYQLKNIKKNKMYNKDENILSIQIATHNKEIKKMSDSLFYVDSSISDQNALSRWESAYAVDQKQDEELPLFLQSVSNLSSSHSDPNSVTCWADRTESTRYLTKYNDNICEKCPKGSPHQCAISTARASHGNSSIGHLRTMEITNLQDGKSKSIFKDNKKKQNIKSKTHLKKFAHKNNQGIFYNQKDYEILQIESNEKLKIDIPENNNIYTTKPNCKIHSKNEPEKTILPSITAVSHLGDMEADIIPRFKTQENQVPNISKFSTINESQSLLQTIESRQDEDIVLYPHEQSGSVAQISDVKSSEDDSSGPASPRISRSIPSSPICRRKKEHSLRGFLYSPLLLRKLRWQKLIDSSDDESNFSGDETFSKNGKNLENSQVATLKKKNKQKLSNKNTMVEEQSNLPPFGEYVLQNKMPLWNEAHQVYQLDFGGRVTQESAKNFQVEHHGKQVLQFGRINMNAYTLDFQQPFCALQAFAIALANITQRLK